MWVGKDRDQRQKYQSYQKGRNIKLLKKAKEQRRVKDQRRAKIKIQERELLGILRPLIKFLRRRSSSLGLSLRSSSSQGEELFQDSLMMALRCSDSLSSRTSFFSPLQGIRMAWSRCSCKILASSQSTMMVFSEMLPIFSMFLMSRIVVTTLGWCSVFIRLLLFWVTTMITQGLFLSLGSTGSISVEQWYRYSQYIFSLAGSRLIRTSASLGISSVQNITLQPSEISARNLPVCALMTSFSFLRQTSTPQGSITRVLACLRDRKGAGGSASRGRRAARPSWCRWKDMNSKMLLEISKKGAQGFCSTVFTIWVMNSSQYLPCFLPHRILSMEMISLLCSMRRRMSLGLRSSSRQDSCSNSLMEVRILRVRSERVKAVSWVVNSSLMMKMTLEEEYPRKFMISAEFSRFLWMELRQVSKMDRFSSSRLILTVR